MPAIMATVVMTMGLARSRQALCSASQRVWPARSSSMANSTSRMEFFAAIPNSIRRPMNTGMSISSPVIVRARAAPARLSGRAARMINGLKKLRNSSTSTP